MEFLSNTAVRVAIGAVTLTATAAGSFLIGKHVGVQEAMAQIPDMIKAMLEEHETPESTTK